MQGKSRTGIHIKERKLENPKPRRENWDSVKREWESIIYRHETVELARLHHFSQAESVLGYCALAGLAGSPRWLGVFSFPRFCRSSHDPCLSRSKVQSFFWELKRRFLNEYGGSRERKRSVHELKRYVDALMGRPPVLIQKPILKVLRVILQYVSWRMVLMIKH